MSSFHQVFSPEVPKSSGEPPVLFYGQRSAIGFLHRVIRSLFVVALSASPPCPATPPQSHVHGDLLTLIRPAISQASETNDREIKAAALLIRSALAQEENDHALAFETLRASWKLNPANPSLAIRLAYEALETENIALAQSILGETAKHCQTDSSLRVHQAVIGLRYQANPKLALGYAEIAYRMSPANPRAISILAESLAALGNIDRIEQLISACASLNVNDPDFWTSTSETFAKGLFTEGELPHPQTLSRFNALLRRSISAGIHDPIHIEKNADLCVMSAQLPEAVRLYRHCLATPDERPAPRRAQTHHKLARTLLSLDKEEDALTAVNQAVALDSANPAHLELRADIHAERKNLNLALHDLARSADLDPESLELQLRTANLELKLHEFAAAAKRCHRLTEMFPTAPTPKVLHAIALASQGKHAEAVHHLAQAESLLAENEQESIGPEILFPLGVAAERAGLHEKAEHLLQKCANSESDISTDAANHLAFMWIESEVKLEAAGQLIQRAVRDRPENPYYRDTLGWWFFKNGRPKAALDELLVALRNMPDPDKPDVHCHLAELYIVLNQPDKAATHLKAAADVRPDTPGIIEKLEILRITNPSIR
jgi:tetratricopeptide (TPR) repeat protein